MPLGKEVYICKQPTCLKSRTGQINYSLNVWFLIEVRLNCKSIIGTKGFCMSSQNKYKITTNKGSELSSRDIQLNSIQQASRALFMCILNTVVISTSPPLRRCKNKKWQKKNMTTIQQDSHLPLRDHTYINKIENHSLFLNVWYIIVNRLLLWIWWGRVLIYHTLCLKMVGQGFYFYKS